MADHIQRTKDEIWRVKGQLAKDESDRNDWAGIVGRCNPRPHSTHANTVQLSGLVDSMATAENSEQRAEFEGMKAEAEAMIPALDANIAKLQQQLAALQAELPSVPQPAAPKFDPEKHPLLRKAIEKQEPEKAVVFSTGDMCEAQWTDKGWYKAKIQSILGSSSAPKYLVRFIEYDDTLTVDSRAVRPLPSKRKREPEPAAATQPTTPVTSTPHVISGPASVNPNAQLAKNDAADDDLAPKKRSKLPSKGQLKKTVGSWKDFTAKGVGKKIAKHESMFRTSTSVGSKGK